MSLMHLFGRSPFSPLKGHMGKVKLCVDEVPKLFSLLEEKRYEALQEVADKISFLEHQADVAKNDIRNHLPNTLFMPIDRSWLLEILELQDHIADHMEDLGRIVTIRPLEFLPDFKKDFFLLLEKNLEAFTALLDINKQFNDLLETTFGGVEAEQVRKMCDRVAFLEHEADLVQRDLIIKLYQAEEQMSYATFDLWKKLFQLVASLSNVAEKIAMRVRMILDLK